MLNGIFAMLKHTCMPVSARRSSLFIGRWRDIAETIEAKAFGVSNCRANNVISMRIIEMS